MRLNKIVTASLLGSVSAYGWAIEPQSIDLRGFEFTPTLLIYQSYDDNYRGLRENTFSSQITGIEPTLTLSAEDRNSAYELQYRLSADYYHDDSNASNTDHHLTLKSALVPTDRHRFNWNLATTVLKTRSTTSIPISISKRCPKTISATTSTHVLLPAWAIPLAPAPR